MSRILIAGGGGFIGNRYFSNAYPAFIFVVTAVRPVWLTLAGTSLASALLGSILFLRETLDSTSLADLAAKVPVTGMIAEHHRIDRPDIVAGTAQTEHRRGVADVTVGHG